MRKKVLKTTRTFLVLQKSVETEGNVPRVPPPCLQPTTQSPPAYLQPTAQHLPTYLPTYHLPALKYTKYTSIIMLNLPTYLPTGLPAVLPTSGASRWRVRLQVHVWQPECRGEGMGFNRARAHLELTSVLAGRAAPADEVTVINNDRNTHFDAAVRMTDLSPPPTPTAWAPAVDGRGAVRRACCQLGRRRSFGGVRRRSRRRLHHGADARGGAGKADAAAAAALT